MLLSAYFVTYITRAVIYNANTVKLSVNAANLYDDEVKNRVSEDSSQDGDEIDGVDLDG